MSGIYALESIARDSEEYRPTIAEVLTVLVQDHAKLPDVNVDGEAASPSEVPGPAQPTAPSELPDPMTC